MEQYVVLNISQVKIGEKTQETEEHFNWSREVHRRKEENDLHGGWDFTPAPKEPSIKTEKVPVFVNIPRIIAISPDETSLRIRFGNKLFGSRKGDEEDLFYGKDFMWIEKLEIKDNKIIANYKTTFSNVVNDNTGV
jgi:hypothetical protein